ncbi:MAG TPA: polyprenyl synthetase family protein, partial [bacterium]|nr:polyprenyl synthetase family protein [bacterium]
KEIAGDIAEGKRTLILIYLLQRISAEQRRRVDQVYRLPREQKTPEQIAEILQWMKETGSVESASQRSRELAREALGLFQKAFALVPDSQAKNDLQEAFDFVISRQL